MYLGNTIVPYEPMGLLTTRYTFNKNMVEMIVVVKIYNLQLSSMP